MIHCSPWNLALPWAKMVLVLTGSGLICLEKVKVSYLLFNARVSSSFSFPTLEVCSSEFERANILFCYGAIHSQIAEGCDSKDESSLKQAVVSLRVSSFSVFPCVKFVAEIQ